jgi:hypothetical protein
MLLVAGCVVLPIPVERNAAPNPASRANIEDKPPPSIVSGETTRAQVLLTLGEPDGRGLGDAWFTYGSVAERGGVHWYFVAVAGTGAGAGPLDNWDNSRRLTVRFDERGVVTDVAVDRKNCNAVAYNTCLSARGGDLAEVDARRAALATAGPLVATYKDFLLIGPVHQRCGSWPLFPRIENDGTLTLGRQGLVWYSSGYKGDWVNLSFADVEAVSAPVRHGLFTWVPVQKKDGSCFYFRIRDTGTSQEDFWSAIHPLVPTAVMPQPRTSP